MTYFSDRVVHITLGKLPAVWPCYSDGLGYILTFLGQGIGVSLWVTDFIIHSNKRGTWYTCPNNKNITCPKAVGSIDY